ncbi:hypothetical protein M0804_004968 [Polistes exclamans]|nr:hypothetical protein M0804_004968 [Polistes exclamans]
MRHHCRDNVSPCSFVVAGVTATATAAVATIASWTDYNLQWNQTEYGGVKDVHITPNKLWKPDILMYNR